MKYNTELGIFGNLQRLYTERNKTNNMVYNNKATTDADILENLASDVDAVEDEFNAITEE